MFPVVCKSARKKRTLEVHVIHLGSGNRPCTSTFNCWIQSKQNIYMFTSKPKFKGGNSFYTKWTTVRLSTFLLVPLTLSCNIHLFCSPLSVLRIHSTSIHSFPLLHVYEYQQSHIHTHIYIISHLHYDLTHFLLHSPLLMGKRVEEIWKKQHSSLLWRACWADSITSNATQDS